MTTRVFAAGSTWCCLLALLALCLASSPARADNIVIFYDLTDTITATLNGVPVNLNVHGPEEVWFSFSGGVPGHEDNYNYYVDLTEPGTGVISDRLAIYYNSAGNVAVRFCSDPSDFAFCAEGIPGPAYYTMEENGLLQYIIGVPPETENFWDKYYAQSEVEPIPEPASLILFGSGLAGLAAILRRRLRR